MYLDKFTKEITTLCLQNKVKFLYVFGSVLTDQFSEKSDIDLVVDIDSNDPFDYADSYFNLKSVILACLKDIEQSIVYSWCLIPFTQTFNPLRG